MAEEKLNPNFLEELFKGCFRSQTILDTTLSHLKYEYLPTQHYKEILKQLNKQYFIDGDKPTIGSISQSLAKDEEVQSILLSVKECELRSNESLFGQLEEYIKRSMFVDLYSQMGDLFNKGKHDEARQLLKDKGEEISNFTIRQKNFEPIFGNYFNRFSERQLNAHTQSVNNRKCPFGIDPLDERTNGGVDIQDTFVIVARSGIGKSIALKHIGVHNARLGRRVLHIQLEGSKQEALDAYDAAIAGCSLPNIETANLSNEIISKLQKSFKTIRGEIHVYAYEQFGKATMNDIRQLALDYEKSIGELDMILLDYIDESDPSTGKHYSTDGQGEKARKQALAREWKDLNTEMNTVGGTATQASDVSVSFWNDPNFVLTRSDIAADKNFVNPFSYVLTLNQTNDEYKKSMMRIYEDKFRKYKGAKIHTIKQNYDVVRFYDPIATKQLHLEQNES